MTPSYPSVDRALGQLIAITGLLIGVALSARVFMSGFPAVEPWWHGLIVLGTMLMLTVAVLGRVLPLPVLRVLWVAIPLLGYLTILLTFPAYLGAEPLIFTASQWWFAASYASFLPLFLAPRAAIWTAIGAGFLPAVSGFLAYGYLPAGAVSFVPVQVGFFVFTGIFIGVRSDMNRFHAAQARAKQQQVETAFAAAQARADAWFTRFVHDNVLATLSASIRFSGSPPEQVRTAARTTLTMLDDTTRFDRPAGEVMSATELARRLSALVDNAVWRVSITPSAEPGMIPADVAEALHDATAEAVRNSMRHAGSGSDRGLTAILSPARADVTISDDGAGFAAAELPADRLGVRDSVLQRMREIDGGNAEIRSESGRGTVVSLGWRR